MQNLQITALFTGPALAAGVQLAKVTLDVTDASGTPLPEVTLTGAETPTAWQTVVQVADGKGTVHYANFDQNGNALTSGDAPYDTGTIATGPTNEVGALSISVVPPAPPAA